MPLDIGHLRNRSSKLGEDDLLKIAFTNAHEYHPDAVNVAKEELRRRGYTFEVVVTKPTGGGATMPPPPPPPPLPQPPWVIQGPEAKATWKTPKKKIVELVKNDYRPGIPITALLMLGSAALYSVVIITGAVLVEVGVFEATMDSHKLIGETLESVIPNLIIAIMVDARGLQAGAIASSIANLLIAMGLLTKNWWIRGSALGLAFVRAIFGAVAIGDLPEIAVPAMFAYVFFSSLEAVGYLALLSDAVFHPDPSTTKFDRTSSAMRLKIMAGVCALGIVGSIVGFSALCLK